MRTIKNLNPFNKLIAFSLVMTFLSCGSYQGSSYYATDGIYGSSSVEITKVRSETQNAKNDDKYQNYFNNMVDDYSSIDDGHDYAYTDIENYSSETNNSNVHVNSQAPWGASSNRTEVYLVNNNPWNGFYGSGFGYGGFSNGGFHNPYWSLYGPYDFYRDYYWGPRWGIGFYSPFRNFGYGYNYYFPYYRYNNYGYRNYPHNRPYSMDGLNRGYSMYSRSKTPRGGRSSHTVTRVNRSTNRATTSSQSSGVSTRVSGANKIINYNVGRSSQNRNTTSNVTSQAGNDSQPNTERTSTSTPKKVISSTNRGRRSANTSNYKSTNYNFRRSSSSPSYSSGRSSSSSSSGRGSIRSSGISSRGR